MWGALLAQGWHVSPSVSPPLDLPQGLAVPVTGCTVLCSQIRWHHLTVPSQDSVSPSVLSLTPLLSGGRGSHRHRRLLAPFCIASFSGNWGLRFTSPRPHSPQEPPWFILSCWSEQLTMCFKGRSRSPSLAACFHGDRPFLPAAILPPAWHRSDLLACGEGQVGNGLHRSLAMGQ